MKITFIMANPRMTGGDRVCAIYAQKLTELGHKVNIITPKRRYISYKMQIKRLLAKKVWLTKQEQNKNHFELLGLNLTYSDDYSPLSNQSIPDADVIIATWWETAEWVNKFSESKGKKIYFIQHHEIHDGLPIARVKDTYRLPFYKISIATWLVDIMKKDYGDDQSVLIPNSVDLNVFHAVRRDKQILPTIGFLFSETEFKAVHIALKVIDKLKIRIPNLRVIAFGANDPVNIFVPEYVELTINPAQEDIHLIYQKCDLWLCCSLIEGFGLTILEAMACRVPVVSTRCGGPEDIIDNNVNGLLCNINDVPALTDASYKILNLTNSKWQIFSDNAYRHAIEYTWDDAAILFENALLNAIDESTV